MAELKEPRSNRQRLACWEGRYKEAPRNTKRCHEEEGHADKTMNAQFDENEVKALVAQIDDIISKQNWYSGSSGGSVLQKSLIGEGTLVSEAVNKATSVKGRLNNTENIIRRSAHRYYHQRKE